MSAFQSFRQWAAESTAFHVAFGFALMGGWAMFANRNHPLPDVLLAGLVQGTISATLTLFLKKGLERMSAMFLRAPQSDEGQGRGIAALIVPPIITAALIFTILFTAHTVAGTPEVGVTISFPFAVSTAYAILYNLRLWRAAHER
jgi:hypothetical protein